jgi:hypothetical protein
MEINVTQIPYSTFIEIRLPFTRFHRIFFKEGSEAHKVFGESIYGRFISPAATTPIEEDQAYLKIEAPQALSNPMHFTHSLQNSLHTKGVRFHDIDLARTYPFAPLK